MWFSKVAAKTEVHAPEASVSKKRSLSVDGSLTPSACSAQDIFDSDNLSKRARHDSPVSQVKSPPASPLFGSEHSSPIEDFTQTPPPAFVLEPRPNSPHPPRALHALWEDALRVYDTRCRELRDKKRDELNEETRRLIVEVEKNEVLDAFEQVSITDDFFPEPWVIVSAEVSEGIRLVSEHGGDLDESLRAQLIESMWVVSCRRLSIYLAQIYEKKNPIEELASGRKNHADVLTHLRKMYSMLRDAVHPVDILMLERGVEPACAEAARNGDKELVAEIINFVDECVAQQMQASDLLVDIGAQSRQLTTP